MHARFLLRWPFILIGLIILMGCTKSKPGGNDTSNQRDLDVLVSDADFWVNEVSTQPDMVVRDTHRDREQETRVDADAWKQDLPDLDVLVPDTDFWVDEVSTRPDMVVRDANQDGAQETLVAPDAWDWDLPDANYFYTPGHPQGAVKDEPAMKDLPQKVDNTALGTHTTIDAVAVVDSQVFIGTDTGVFQVQAGQNGYTLVAVPALDTGERPVAITKDPFEQGACVVSQTQALCRQGRSVSLDFTPVGAATGNHVLYLVGSHGLYTWDGQKVVAAAGPGQALRGVAGLGGGRLAVLGDMGVAVGKPGDWKLVKYGSGALPYQDCKSIASDGKTLVVGCKKGIAMMKIGQDTWKHMDAAPGGLPARGVRSVSVNGPVIALAYEYGCGAITNGAASHVDYYVSHRWLPSDDCRVAAVDASGTRWFGTGKGLACIRLQQQDIQQKADWLFQDLKAHFVRMGGFLSPSAFVDKNGHYHLPDSDNDGQWTQEMIGGLCFAYAVTGDRHYKDLAWQAIQNMFLLVDVPAVSFQAKGMKRGFVARSLCRQDEPCFQDKAGLSNWHLVEYKGQKYYWKDDTSSDEIVGHFFGYPIYYDLCAEDEAQKKAVADHALAIANYIVDNGLRLIDLDGKETQYGHWQPDRLAIALDGFGPCMAKYQDADTCASAAFGGGWLNSIEILGLLLSAYHMSGDPRFFNTFKTLILKYKYWKLAMGNENTFTITKPAFQNHCDEELAMLSFTTLLRYESDPQRRAYWLSCLKWLYEHVKSERNPLHAGITAIFLPDIVDAGTGARSLWEMPARDRRRVEVDNSHRVDAKSMGQDRFRREQFDRVFPYDEIRTMWWDKNPYVKVADKGMEGEVNGPMAFLTAYWAMRYAGVLATPSK